MHAGKRTGSGLNRRQMLMTGGAGCLCGLWGYSLLAQAADQFRGCIEVEPWYAATLGRNPLAAGMTQAQAKQISAGQIQSMNRGNRAPAGVQQGLTMDSRVLSSLSAPAQNDAQRALEIDRSGNAVPNRRLESIVARLKLWPRNSSPTFGFLDRNPTLQQNIRGAINEWRQYTCLNFRETNVVSSADIRISFVDRAGHYSLLGIDSREQRFSPNLSGRFESLNLDPTGGDASYLQGTARHEIGHAIGTAHEHSIVTNGINWDRQAVFDYFRRSQGWDNQTILNNILDKLEDTTQYAFTPRDPDSVMHYFFPQQLAPGSQIPTRPNLQLSATDKSFVSQQYGCSGAAIPRPDGSDTSSGPPTETARPEPTDREKLRVEDAIDLPVDTVITGDFPSDSPLHLYTFELESGGDYVIETVDGAREGKQAGRAMPVVIELFDGTNFSEARARKVSRFGATRDKKKALGSLGISDAFLRANLVSSKTYYVLVRPAQRLKSRSARESYQLLLRQAAAKRPDDLDEGSWDALGDAVQEILGIQDEVKGLQGELRKWPQ